MGHLADLLESFYQTLAGADGLTQIRAKSWSRFCDTPFPRIQIDPVTLPSRTPDPAEVERARLFDHTLVFLDGHYLPDLSNPGPLKPLTLSQAQTTYGTFLGNRLGRLLKGEQDPLSLLNGALHGNGAFLYLPPNTQIPGVVQVIHLVSDRTLASPRLHLYAGAGSQIELLSTLSTPTSALVNGMVDLAVEENASVKLTALTDAPQATLFSAVRSTQKRDSRLEVVIADRGAKRSDHDIRASLLEPNSDVHLSGTFCLSAARSAQANILVEHLAPYTTSSQLFKNLLSDRSRSRFAGKIWVDREAQKTDAFQLNNNLLLSEGAIAYSEPNLEIFADDVKASHGSTTGQLGEEELFYLTSRGVATKGAKQLLVKGFIGEVGERLPYPCRQTLNQWICDVTD
ncbi:MAG: Fe-S cluster assembly protein SufD [Parachlamydiales bacterium]